MKICFILPGFTRTPIGGYKIVYEYANRLSTSGNQVSLVFLNNEKMRQFGFPEFIRLIFVNFFTQIEPRWFLLNKNIKKISGQSNNFIKKVNNYDVVFATGIQTVELVKNNFGNAKKIYFIQGYENWGVTEEYLHNTYKYGFTNITVSRWLKEIVDVYSEKSSYLLKNPIDTTIYQRKVNQKDRTPYTIGLLYHTEKIKGVRYALAAIYKLKEKYSNLSVEMFGMFPEPKNLPEWIHYKRGATQKETVNIYNKVQVFLCASIEEGYGLTGLEAMACGACLVSTSYKGVLEYAENGYNALLSPVKDIDMLIKHVSELFENQRERIRLSNNGVESVKIYSWDETMNKLNYIINK